MICDACGVGGLWIGTTEAAEGTRSPRKRLRLTRSPRKRLRVARLDYGVWNCEGAKVRRCGCFVNRERSAKWALNLLGLSFSLRGSREGSRVARLVFGEQVGLLGSVGAFGVEGWRCGVDGGGDE